ncbi:hypothetical protein SK128_018932, partial [Halocaridina rubra]
DVWQLGILIYVLLTGQLPWQKADLTDPNYSEYVNWRKRRTLRTPKKFSNFTSRLLRMFKRLLEPKPDKRSSVREVYKYPADKWLIKLPRRDASDQDNQSICYSTFSAHSCPKEKDRVLRTLKAAGIETTVDRIAKRQRIHDWLEHSLSTKMPEEEDQKTREGPRALRVELVERRQEPSQSSQTDKRLHESLRKQYEDLAALTIETAHSKTAAVASHATVTAQENASFIAQERKSRINDSVPQANHKPIDPRKGEIINSGVIVVSGNIITPVRRLSRPRAHSNSPHLRRRASANDQKRENILTNNSTAGRTPLEPAENNVIGSPVATRRHYGRSDRTECGYELKHSKTYGYFPSDQSDEVDSLRLSHESSSSDTSLASVLVKPDDYN